jgi:hypothetical protein
MKNYRFNKEKHLHEIEVDGEWKSLTGCTTILSVLAKPALISWAAKMAVEYIRENILKFDLSDPKQFEQLLLEAKSAHTKRKEKAGEWGTEIHSLIENYIKTGKEDKKIKNFIDWAIKNKVKFLSSEKNVWSEKLWIGGIVDFVCEIDGQIWIGDIKTSGSGIYPEHFWQCSGYDLMLKDMNLYPNVAGYLILNLKENGDILEKRSISNGDNTKAFLACLDIYRIQEKIKNQVI